jgi:hypothetical protein
MYRILSIDGGGFRGIYSAYLLKRIEEEMNIEWTQYFNLITGTSTGSIIAAGLVTNNNASEIFNLYKSEGNKIFKKRFRDCTGYFSSKYSNHELSRVLKDYFGDKKLGEITFPLIIPATDIGNGCVHVFKSFYDQGFVRDKNVLVRDAVLASCSAPTYFDPYLYSNNDKKYLLADGGLWANNPSLVAIIDAKKRLNINLSDIRILSIGSGSEDLFYSLKKSKWLGWGFLAKWGGSKFINMLLNLQSESAHNMTGLLIEREQILRLSFKECSLSLDDPSKIDDLITRADKLFTYNADKLKLFLKGE